MGWLKRPRGGLIEASVCMVCECVGGESVSQIVGWGGMWEAESRRRIRWLGPAAAAAAVVTDHATHGAEEKEKGGSFDAAAAALLAFFFFPSPSLQVWDAASVCLLDALMKASQIRSETDRPGTAARQRAQQHASSLPSPGQWLIASSIKLWLVCAWVVEVSREGSATKPTGNGKKPSGESSAMAGPRPEACSSRGQVDPTKSHLTRTL